jgi:hypothetical protein
MTTINQATALRRFHQGLFYLLGMTDQGREKPAPEIILAVTTVMAYLAAYAFPDDNLYGVKQRMQLAFEPLKSAADVEGLLNKALDLAEVFRRPWTEPGDLDGPTI